MKIFKPILIVLLGFLLTITSCRTEDDLIIDPPIEAAITANSYVANLISRTTSNDGSMDNIIDNASCFSVELPVIVTVNDIEIEINNNAGYQDIEDIIDLFDDDIDSIIISYPITVVLTDFSTEILYSDSELAVLSTNCNGENEDDDDIECIDFQYPISASVFNEDAELIETIIIINDNSMYDFIDDLDEFIAGYAHLYCYDFLMLKTLLERTGFNEIKQMEFCKSALIDYTEPLHVTGLDSEWKNFNQEFYKRLSTI